jgi:uncharacterized protein YjiS (DUF1127 family)
MTMITDRIRTGSLGDHRRTSPRASLWALAGAAVDNIATTLFVWLERARQRRELLGLNDRELHDFGVSRCGAASEGGKPFWRA